MLWDSLHKVYTQSNCPFMKCDNFFVIYLAFSSYFNTSCHAMTLTFDLELLWSFGRHVITLCVQFEQNRTIRCRVIDNVKFLRGSRFYEMISEVCGTNFTKPGEDIRPSSLLAGFVSALRYLAALSNAGRSKMTDVEHEAKFRTF